MHILDSLFDNEDIDDIHEIIGWVYTAIQTIFVFRIRYDEKITIDDLDHLSDTTLQQWLQEIINKVTGLELSIHARESKDPLWLGLAVSIHLHVQNQLYMKRGKQPTYILEPNIYIPRQYANWKCHLRSLHIVNIQIKSMSSHLVLDEARRRLHDQNDRLELVRNVRTAIECARLLINRS